VLLVGLLLDSLANLLSLLIEFAGDLQFESICSLLKFTFLLPESKLGLVRLLQLRLEVLDLGVLVLQVNRDGFFRLCLRRLFELLAFLGKLIFDLLANGLFSFLDLFLASRQRFASLVELLLAAGNIRFEFAAYLGRQLGGKDL